MDLSIAKMAKSPFRCATYGSDIEAFTAAHGGSLSGTMHCARYFGKRVFIDGVTKEVIDSEGVALSGMEHLIEEFDKLSELLGEKMQGPFHADGVIIPVQKGKPHFRIYDMYAPDAESPFTLWTQINMLADVFMLLDKVTMYMRPVQYFHSRSFSTQKAYDRWIKTWTKRAGCGGVIFKGAEMVYEPNTVLSDACEIAAR
ncbi:hypothetical protein [Halodesulfovibrio marinisediminis]|uniref:Uncharacterized protein n=1 Tax=Halodesulfovibrio marinisediminis DSM 17456 TaxID=1121457 RepID=A0A1N6J412_9BACT|nr:hypothetical protein [Halodesulfovibrio marinisediminis]SIO38981.1 hypothetical protein SAMN02745161_3129 [Halodesulfovibrio marinisediminis DSM 17456]